MATVRQATEEDDVVALRVPIGASPAGTTGTGVSLHEDSALVELAEDDPPLDNLVDIPFEQLEPVRSGRTGWVDRWKPNGSLSGRDAAANDPQLPSRCSIHASNRQPTVS